VARLAFQGLAENEIGRVRISMMARNKHVPFKGRIQKRKTNLLQIITFGLQRAAGPYSRAKSRPSAIDGGYRRRASGFVSSQAQSMNNCATGLSVRFFRVMMPTGN
jgi:hypothetical protein